MQQKRRGQNHRQDESKNQTLPGTRQSQQKSASEQKQA
jgi:hypothetical protein